MSSYGRSAASDAVFRYTRSLLAGLGCNDDIDDALLCGLLKIEVDGCQMNNCVLTNGQIARLVAAAYLEMFSMKYSMIGNISDGNLKYDGTKTADQLFVMAKSWRAMIEKCCQSKRKKVAFVKMGSAKCLSAPKGSGVMMCGCLTNSCKCGNVKQLSAPMMQSYDCCDDCGDEKTIISNE